MRLKIPSENIDSKIVGGKSIKAMCLVKLDNLMEHRSNATAKVATLLICHRDITVGSKNMI